MDAASVGWLQVGRMQDWLLHKLQVVRRGGPKWELSKRKAGVTAEAGRKPPREPKDLRCNICRKIGLNGY